MRILTPDEARQIQRLKDLITADKIDRIHFQAAFGWDDDFIWSLPENRELWLGLLEMILQTNEALSLAWKRSPNPKTGYCGVSQE